MGGLKVTCMKMERLVLLDRLSFLPCALRKLPEAFDLSASKSWYRHYFNTEEKLDYVGLIPEIWYYKLNEMSEEERKDFLVWYENHKSEHFDNRLVLDTYCQDDVTALRQACQVLGESSGR